MLSAKAFTRQNLPTLLKQLGFSQEQINYFLLLHLNYRTGFYQRDLEAYNRLEFARWLYQRGKLTEE